jgi:SAM-dependent methyltransferase
MRLTGAAHRLRLAWREGRTDATMHVAGYRAWRTTLADLGIPSVTGLRVLEIGCGERCQLSLMFAADGAEVTAVDSLPVALGFGRPRMWATLAREDGLATAARQVVRDVVHTVRYWRTLRRVAGRPLRSSAVRLVRADATRLPFADASFDLVVSSAVWEHIGGVEAATREVGRVLRHGGLAMIQIALFPSLQGGHHGAWHAIGPDSAGRVRPWDHLRTGRLPFPVYLNGWREAQYRDVFERSLTVRRWEDGEMRGDDYLTPELANELIGYTKRDLLLSSITAWAGPPARPRSGSEGPSE